MLDREGLTKSVWTRRGVNPELRSTRTLDTEVHWNVI